jgi:hypothetical protein
LSSHAGEYGEVAIEEKEKEVSIELQLEEVDMNNEDMDALEWIVRKTIPIPKKYYWETGNTDLPLRIKAWHQTVGSLSAAVKWIERVGEPVVAATGITTSRFDYVGSTMTDKQWEKARASARERREKIRQSRRALSVEEGEL